MKLSTFKHHVHKLNQKANKEYVGKFFSIPTSVLEKNDSSYISMCKVWKINLSENAVELIYEADGEDDLWTSISISDFEKYSKSE